MPEPTEAAIALYREILLDDELSAMRERYCRVVSESLTNIASWLGVDSWIGTGDVPASDLATETERSAPDADRYTAFRAMAAVIEMASELASEAIAALDADRRYAASALIRQLIETEYLLAAFDQDLARTWDWARATPADIRNSWTPQKMRNDIGGFSNMEYWQHCDMGGHPAPRGRALLRFGMHVPLSEYDYLTKSVWGDLAQHLRRVWARTNNLLSTHHARYEQVRSEAVQRVQDIETPWLEADPLATSVDFALLNELTEQAERTEQ